MNNNLLQYLITDPKYYSNDKDLFKKNLEKVLKNKKVDMACFRDKESKNFNTLAEVFVQTCKEFNIKEILINSNYSLAHALGATGVHLTSKQFDEIKEAKKLNLYTIISCHTFHDIEKALNSYCNAVTYSPIFDTPNKGEPKGITTLKEAISLYEDIDIFALGGIVNQEHVEQVSKTKACGFASIRYFI
ncbi:thiamine phosphate synthase [bacterium]|jgi:thiamine-phosphate pyrophosphorylase|nr:thiamine phosphate synthase [bacterium]